MFVTPGSRRTLARHLPRLIAAATVAGMAALASPTAQAAPPDAGLFGTSDPTYDGVYRQSLAIMGLQESGAKVPASAVTWLLGQQCLDGSFAAYRASIRTACPAPDTDNFTGPDTNSTALASMALAAVGKTEAAGRAAKALVSAQNADGGWGYIIGGASDADSTGLVLAALDHSSKDESTAEAKGLAYLRSIAGPCTNGVASLPFQKGQAPNLLASSQALLGLNTGLIGTQSKARYTPAQKCTESLDQKLAEYLVGELKKGKGVLPSAMDPAKPDYNTTAWAVVGLVGANRPASELTPAVRQLQEHAREYVGVGTSAAPAAAGTLAIVAEHVDGDARSFGGVNLVTSITRSIRK